jgi:hypothetical protein
MIALPKTCGPNGQRKKFRRNTRPYLRNQTTLSENMVQQGVAGAGRSTYAATDDESAYAEQAPCDWIELVQCQLDEIESLSNGWDSNGSSSPVQCRVESARDFIECLAQAENLPQPYVNPSRNGGVQFEWEFGPRYFEVEIVGEGTAIFFYCDTQMREEEEGNLRAGESLENVLQYIHRVYGH